MGNDVFETYQTEGRGLIFETIAGKLAGSFSVRSGACWGGGGVLSADKEV